ncbi:MAG: cupin domain-containing protein [Dehalococcoidia bacterium]|nr:cupin domain-containing protein [Dehalococcoidia bacterium]
MSDEFVRATEDERKAMVTTVDSIPRVILRPGSVTAIVPTSNMTLSFLELAPGLEAKPHSHPEEQVVVVLEGELDLACNGKLYRAHAGELVVIPGGVPHSAVTLDRGCRVLDIFSPARKDFAEKLQQAVAANK